MSDLPASDIDRTDHRPIFQENNLPAFADIEQVRWHVLIDADGEKIGTIESIEVDEETGRVEFLEVGHGGFLGFGAERFLVPVTRIVQIEAKTVQIDRRSTSLEGVPGYEPDRLSDPVYRQDVRGWWVSAQESDSDPDARLGK